MSIAENVRTVREKMNAAALAAGRKPEEILLVAATKMNSADRVREAVAAGVDVCGENRVQELLEKQAQGAYAGVPLHFIGHLQKNKVRQIVGLAELIHGVDSLALLEVIQRCAAGKGLVQDVLLEVNIGAEESKSGTTPETAPELVRQIAELPHVHVKGLMCVAPIVEDPEEARPYFHRMKELAAEIDAMGLAGVSMKELSMGMTADFEVAVEEGATFVRVGTAIFGHRDYAIQ